MDKELSLLSQKKLLPRTFSILSVFLFLMTANTAKAQLYDSGQILRAGAEDANTLLKEYLRPFGGGFGADLNSGWFTSAKPLSKFGFDLRISASASWVPQRDRMFDVTQLNLSTVGLLRGPAETPTAFGEDTETSTLGTTYFNSSTNQEEEQFSFEMPEGSGYHFVPAPMAQFSLGLPGHTQITLRYTPTITIDREYRFNVFGVGGMIGLNPLLFKNSLPVDISLQAGMMDLNAHADFDVQPRENTDIENTYPDSHWNGQGVDFNTQTFAANILAGKQFSIISLFAGVGYQYASTRIETRGSYPVVVPSDNSNGPSEEIQSLDEPINFTLNGVNKIHVLGGFQLKIAFLSISAAYTHAEYPTLRAGVGIMIGS